VREVVSRAVTGQAEGQVEEAERQDKS